jgi:hypothetical protein
MGGVAEEPCRCATWRDPSPARRLKKRNFSISGGTAYSNNITIDGLETTTIDRRRTVYTSIDAVDEVQIIRNQFAAEYGRASGASTCARVAARTSFADGLTILSR